MANPTAGVVIAVTGIVASNSLDELVAKSDDALVEVVEVVSRPVGTGGSRNGVSPCKGNVENVRIVVAGAGLAAAAHALSVAGRGQRKGDLAYTWSDARTVGVAPNAVELIVTHRAVS